MTTKHTHGSNFGKHVDGCPRCMELKNGATPVAWAKKPVITIYKHVCSAKCGPVCTHGDW